MDVESTIDGLTTPALESDGAAPPSALRGGSFEKYELVREVGRGGMGKVYLAIDRDLQRETALKLCQRTEAAALDRFLFEARIGSRLDHPNIAPIYDAGPAPGGNAYFAMKFVDGTPLSHIICQLGVGDEQTLREYPLTRRLEVFCKVLEGVAYAHARRVIHRDLKPANVMVGAFGEVIVVDWGLAKIIRGTGPDASSAPEVAGRAGRTMDGAVVGTPGYLAPEQALGDTEAHSRASDTYTLGVMLYELLTCARPFPGDDVTRLIEDAAEGHFVPPRRCAPGREVPRALEAVVLKAMSVSPGDRYPDAGAMLMDVRAYLAGRPLSVYRPPWHERALRVARCHPLALVCSVLGAVLVMTLALIAWQLELAKGHEQRRTIAAQEAARRAQEARLEAEQMEAVVARRAARLADEARARAERRHRALGPYMHARRRMAWRLDFAALRRDVVPELKRVLEIDPDFLEARVDLLKVYIYLGRRAELVAHTREMVDHLPAADRDRLTPFLTPLAIGMATGMPPKVPDDLEPFRPTQLPSSTWRTLIAMFLLKAKAYDQALQHIDGLIEDPRTRSWEAVYIKAQTLLRMRRYAEARAVLDPELDRLPQMAILWLQRGQARHRLKDLAGARRDLQRAARLDPAFQTIWSEMALLVQSEGGRARKHGAAGRARYLAGLLAAARYSARAGALEPSTRPGTLTRALARIRKTLGAEEVLAARALLASARGADARREAALYADMVLRAVADAALRGALARSGVSEGALRSEAAVLRARRAALRGWLVPSADPVVAGFQSALLGAARARLE